MAKLRNVDFDGQSRPLCLELANTVRWHASDHPEETLHSYADLVAWAQRVRLISNHEARKLLRGAADQPAEASRVLKRATALRETIYCIFVALIHKQPPTQANLAELNDILAKLTRGARIVKTTKGFAWNWNVNEDALDSLIAPIALSAAELLISEQRERVGQCADDRGCGWLFLDTSKNHTRRWCDINDCGNRAKQRRHYERTRKHT
jgi:predicted RNA-binding Zn ribbon-like protein